MDRKRIAASQGQRRTANPLRLTDVGKATVALVGAIGTIIATVYLLIDHGVFTSSSSQNKVAEVLNAAVRELKAPINGGSNWAGESQLGDLVADAYREIGATQISFINSYGIRANIRAGQVSRSDLASVLPYPNRLVKMELTGGQVWALLAQQFTSNEVLQISGLRFTYRVTPQGKGVIRNIEQLSLGRAPTPVPNNSSKRYTVVVDSFLADGGDGFSALTGGTKRVATKIGIAHALAQYIGTLTRPFDSGIQGRIIRTG